MVSMAVTAVICGISARKVLVEADVSDGMPVFSLVGYLSSEVKEAHDRVRTALKNIGITLPVKRITVNLSPADLRKSGTSFDLSIAAALLASIGYIPPEELDGIMLIGELGLNGDLRPVRGVLEMVSCAASFGCHTCVVPEANLAEGSVIRNVRVLGASSLMDVLMWMNHDHELLQMDVNIEEVRKLQKQSFLYDFSEIRGQFALRRAAEVAVSGFHHLLIIGPPGAGKSMTAKRIPSILPETTVDEVLEISRIHSIAGILPQEQGLMTIRPFRSPHHTITQAALSGGGIVPHPGEISLAHRGVLYLDELPEFAPGTLEVLRQPLEDKEVVISRSSGCYRFPSNVMLIASMNPCKCGYYPDRSRCRCSERDVRQYLNRISRPLLDRIDLCVEAEELSYDQIRAGNDGESSDTIRGRVEGARKIQAQRYEGTPFCYNADLTGKALEQYCCLGTREDEMMQKVYRKLHLTGRSYARILKVARTIADLDGEERIRTDHLAEAVGYRALDEKYWG